MTMVNSYNPGPPAPAGQWYRGLGFWYQSPDGDVNKATQITRTDPNSPGGTFTPIGSVDMSAKAILNQTLALYGLGSLGDTAWQWYLGGKTPEQILLDMRQTPEYKTRFPAMEELGKNGHAISESQYINYETSAKEMMVAAGLPPGFYDQPTDFSDFLSRGIGLPELQQRLDVAKNAAYNAPPEVLQALHDFYGVNGRAGSVVGDIAAYFLDPNKATPAIQKQFVAAQEAGAAQRTGWGPLSQTDAERLAAQGVTDPQAQAGFQSLAHLHEIMGALPGEAGGSIDTATQLGSAFSGNAGDKDKIENRQRQRVAAFNAGGGYQTTKQGATGVGEAQV